MARRVCPPPRLALDEPKASRFLELPAVAPSVAGGHAEASGGLCLGCFIACTPLTGHGAVHAALPR